MPEKAPSPRRAAYLRTVRREKRRVRIWQIALVAGLFAVWELSCRLGLSDGIVELGQKFCQLKLEVASIWRFLSQRAVCSNE